MVFAAIFLDEERAESRQEGHQEGKEEGRHEGREEGRHEGREEGLEEGLARADLAWREWNVRRMEAALNGAPFDEPPPDFTNGHPNEPA